MVAYRINPSVMEAIGIKSTSPQKELLNRKEAAAYIDFKPGTLAVWHSTRRYDLRPIKVGRSIRYRKSDLDEFLRKHQFSPD